MLPVLENMTWPEEPQATPAGRTTYDVGLEQVDSYRGDPKMLGKAVQTFQTADSRPYAFAGVAYVLLAAAQEGAGAYDQSGLDAALSWLEKAQETAPDLPHVNVIEAQIYIHSGRLDDARLVLDYLQSQDSHSYYIQRAEMLYWQARGDLERAISWCEKTMRAADTVPQRLRLQQILGDMQLKSGKLAEAEQTLREAAHFDAQNPQIWHKLSIVYWQMENYEEAALANERALTLRDFPAAREMQTALQQKGIGRKGVTGWLRGR